MAHGLGAGVALFLVALQVRIFSNKDKEAEPGREKISQWYYLAGVPGTLTVILAAVTVNSSLKLAGTVSLMLVGQIFFGIISDRFGLLGVAKRKIGFVDLLVVLLVLAGSALIIFGRL